MSDKTSKQQLRAFFGIRNTRAVKLNNILPNFKTLTNKEIYNQLQDIYDAENRTFNASFNGLIFKSEATKGGDFKTEPVSIPDKVVKSKDEYIKYVYDFLQAPLYKTNYTIYRIQINGQIVYIRPHPQASILNRPTIDLQNYKKAEAFLSSYITLQQVTTPPNAKPVLCSTAPRLQFTTNTPTEYNKLCCFVEILNLTGGTRKRARTIEELTQTTANLCEDLPLYETDETGDFLFMDNGDELIPIPSAMTPDNIIKNGITQDMLFRLCESLKIPLCVFYYEDDTTRHKLKRETTNTSTKKQKGLTGIIENNHFYLLNDINTIRRFNGTIQDEPKGRRVKAKEEPEQIILNDGKTAYDFLMSADCLPCFLTLNDGVFNSFVVNKTKHILNPHPEAVEFYGDQYTGQTPQSVAAEYLKTIEPVYMTHEIYDALTAENVKHRTHADTLHPQYFTDGLPNHEGVKKYDLNKAYKFAMRNLSMLYGLDITQTIHKEHQLTGDGLYYAEPYNTGGVLHGKNWYSLPLLQYAQDIGETYKITFKINVTQRDNTLPLILDEIDEDITHKAFNKQVANTLTGLTGITKQKQAKVKITKSQNDLMTFIHKATNPFIKTEGDLYFYGYKTETAKRTNHLLLYIQILDQFNIINHQRATGTGGLLIARHIDAFYVLNPTNTDHLSDKEGDYKPEEFKQLINHKKARDAPYKHKPKYLKNVFVNDNADLTLDDLKNGLLITGAGGTGKTHSVKKLLKDDAEFIAPTNAAALKLGGKTIHNFLNIDMTTGKANFTKTLKKYIVIDEASMITSDIWLILSEYKRQNPHLIFILLGDRHQLPSIESIQYDFNTVPAILHLTNYNYTELTKNYRQDLDGLKLSNAIINNEPYDLPKTQTKINADEIHLCYYNKTRRWINKQLNKPTPESVKIILNEDIVDATQGLRRGVTPPHERVKPITGFLHKGVKVICNKTIKGAFVNSESATIESVDDIITFTDGRSVELKTFSTHFTLSYAITVYKAQGQTYTQKVNIHDIDMMLTNYKFIYTAISRATEYKNLFFRY
jgi:predicted GNAT family acetyltransferase